jgi:hypothetical protein
VKNFLFFTPRPVSSGSRLARCDVGIGESLITTAITPSGPVCSDSVLESRLIDNTHPGDHLILAATPPSRSGEPADLTVRCENTSRSRSQNHTSGSD